MPAAQRAVVRDEAERAIRLTDSQTPQTPEQALVLRDVAARARADLATLDRADADPSVRASDAARAERLEQQRILFDRARDPEWSPTRFDSMPDIDPVGLAVGKWTNALSAGTRLMVQIARSIWNGQRAAGATDRGTTPERPAAVISAPHSRDAEIRSAR